jgi:serine/threonine-protein kinase
VIGTELGNYRIIAPIGEGALGVVYLAEHRLLGSKVALKRFTDAIAGDPELRQRVVTAARTAAKCRHAHLVAVLDLIDSNEHLALAMELLEGESLAAHLKGPNEPAPPAETWRLLEPVLDAVAYAHSQGVVHGGLRPGNILLARLGGHTVAKVTDLGLPGRLSLATSPGKDPAGEPAAWLHYAAPEQHADGDMVTPAADIYALGVLLFEALTGTRPFHEVGASELVNAVRTRRAPGIRSVRPSLSHESEDVIKRALEMAPAARWPDCRALAGALEAALAAPSPATAPVPAVPGLSAAPAAQPPVGAPPYTAPAQSPQPVPQPAPQSAASPVAQPAPRAGYPPLGRRTRQGALRDDPALTAMEPKSTARDKWIVAGTVVVCLVALLVAMIVALTGREGKPPSTSNANTNINRATATTPPAGPQADAGAVATDVTCATLRGNWSGVFYAGPGRLAHHFTGTVHGTPRDCRATFRITTNRRGYVIQYFQVTIVLGRITFRGTRVDTSMSPYGYSKDTFVGHLDLARTRFSGRVRDSKGVVGNVRMRKK